MSEEKTTTKNIMQQLQAPFAADEIEWRVGSTNKEKTKGMALAYVTNRAIQNRLDNTFGCFGWKNEYKEWKSEGQLCGISVFYDGGWVTKWDGADNSNMEATKGGLSDAMKRAAYQWGIGRYLYKLPAQWMPIKPQGKSYALAQTPNLPSWALPEGKTKKEPKEKPKKSDYISDAQRKRLFALAKENDVNEKDLKNLIGMFGYGSSSQIAKKDYKEICEKIEEGIK